MTLMSMTGFARGEGAHDAWRWFWEVRSVNGRGLDARLRLPPGLESLEPRLRERVNAGLSRGTLNISLQIQREAVTPQVRINAGVLEEIARQSESARAGLDIAPATLDGLLAIKGVVEVVEEDDSEEARAAREAALLASFDGALEALVAARAGEGARIGAVLTGQFDALADLAARAASDPARAAEAIRERLSAQVSRLLDQGERLDPDRLHQEAILLAAKADVQEELDRLDAHIASARELIAGGGAVGRRLDFLTQELNREANTLCSKANDVSLSRIGLEMKSVIDQIREQVQNVE